MSYFLLDEFENIEPYNPGEQPDDREYLKLNANESSFPPSPKVLEAIDKAHINVMSHYSDPYCWKLRKAIGDHFGVSAEEVFVGNGADEVLSFCLMSFFRPGMKICFPDITYDFYRIYAKAYRLDYEQIPLRDDFTLDIEPYIESDRDVIIANPNNPTGLAIQVSEIERLVASNKNRMVIIDEAYVDFGNESVLPLVKKYSNLVVVYTFSKSRNMPGARIGFAISSKAIIEDMNKIKFAFNPFNLSSLTIEGGCAAVNDEVYFEYCVNSVIKEREELEKKLSEIGYEVIPTTTNFVFFKAFRTPAGELTAKLKKKGILVRHYDDERVCDYIRMTVGTHDEMERVLVALLEIENSYAGCKLSVTA